MLKKRRVSAIKWKPKKASFYKGVGNGSFYFFMEWFMKFYHITDDYITFLRQFDSKVSENKNQTRPYVGVVLEIDSIKYDFVWVLNFWFCQ